MSKLKKTSPIENIHFESGTYKGELKGGIPHGTGSYIHKEEESDLIITYSGSWKEGKREGEGTESTLSTEFPGRNYVGSWKDNLRHGIGKEVSLAPRLLYEGYYGEWSAGQRNGLGVQKTGFQGVSAGEFRDGLLENGQVRENDEVTQIVVDGREIFDLLGLIPGVKKKITPFTQDEALRKSEKKYKAALKKYNFE